MASWGRARLGDLVETQKGYAFKSGWYCDTGRSIVKVSDFTNDSVDSSELVCIPESTATDYLKYELRTGDVVVQTVGSWPTNPASVVGKCVRIPESVAGALLNQNAVKLTPAVSFDRTFLFYLLRNEDFKTYIIGTAQGAASQAAITLDAIRGYEFNLPPLPAQQRIAGILSAYDELIENSQRRIKVLESMARALYREWFVNFRFPGHESVPRVPSSLGEIPQGWEVKKLGELLNVDKGVSYNGAGLTEDGNPMVNLKNIQAGGGFRRDATKPYSGDFKSRHTVKPGDVVLANTDLTQAGNVVASPALIPRLEDDKPILISHHLYAVRPVQQIAPIFVYHLMLTDGFRGFAKGFAIGTTVLGLPKEGILNYSFACPPSELICDFVVRASAIHELTETLYERIDNLRRTRDLLLPRLLSGQLSDQTFAPS